MNKFSKTLIYIIITSILVIILLTQPYNIICRLSGKCNPITFNSLKKFKNGQETIVLNFQSDINKKIQDVVYFYPLKKYVKAVNGKNIENNYKIKNLTDKKILVKASYHIYPNEANKYLYRIECLCFNNQILAPNEEVNMPIKFIIDPLIEKDQNLKGIKKIIIKYKIKTISHSLKL